MKQNPRWYDTQKQNINMKIRLKLILLKITVSGALQAPKPVALQQEKRREGGRVVYDSWGGGDGEWSVGSCHC